MSDAADESAPEGLVWLLRKADQSLQAQKEQRLRPTGLTAAQFSALIRIGVRAGISSAELARELQVSPQAVTGLVGRLEARGYVRRERHPSGMNIHELRLSDEGRRVLDAASELVSELDADVERQLGEKEAQHLKLLLGRLTRTAETEA